jgi:hypothetical protein
VTTACGVGEGDGESDGERDGEVALSEGATSAEFVSIAFVRRKEEREKTERKTDIAKRTYSSPNSDVVVALLRQDWRSLSLVWSVVPLAFQAPLGCAMVNPATTGLQLELVCVSTVGTRQRT